MPAQGTNNPRTISLPRRPLVRRRVPLLYPFFLKTVLFAGAALCVLTAAPAWAQGPVSGTVLADFAHVSESANVRGATVVLDDRRVGVTDAQGHFTIPAVAPGPHVLQ